MEYQKPHYKVWVEIEYINEEEDVYQNVGEPKSVPIIFEDLVTAEKFRDTMLRMTEQMLKWAGEEKK